MATKQKVELLRGVRMPATRGENGKIVHSGGVITEAEELDKATLKTMAEKGYVAGMEPAPAEEGEESGGTKKTATKSKG